MRFANQNLAVIVCLPFGGVIGVAELLAGFDNTQIKRQGEVQVGQDFLNAQLVEGRPASCSAFLVLGHRQETQQVGDGEAAGVTADLERRHTDQIVTTQHYIGHPETLHRVEFSQRILNFYENGILDIEHKDVMEVVSESLIYRVDGFARRGTIRDYDVGFADLPDASNDGIK